MDKLTYFVAREWRTLAFVAGISIWLQLNSILGAVALGLGIWALVDGKEEG